MVQIYDKSIEKKEDVEVKAVVKSKHKEKPKPITSYRIGRRTGTKIDLRTEKEILEHLDKECRYCIYHGGNQTGNEKVSARNLYCNYLEITGHMRPCLGSECREMGVFIREKKKKKGEKSQ